MNREKISICFFCKVTVSPAPRFACHPSQLTGQGPAKYWWLAWHCCRCGLNPHIKKGQECKTLD